MEVLLKKKPVVNEKFEFGDRVEKYSHFSEHLEHENPEQSNERTVISRVCFVSGLELAIKTLMEDIKPVASETLLNLGMKET